MATKAAQLAEWLKELQDKVDEDGNISNTALIAFVSDKKLGSKQYDAVLKYLAEKNIQIIYPDDDLDEEGPTEADIAAEANDDYMDDVIPDDEDD